MILQLELIMTLKTFKPYTKSTRGTVVVDKSSLWKGLRISHLPRAKILQVVGTITGELHQVHIGWLKT